MNRFFLAACLALPALPLAQGAEHPPRATANPSRSVTLAPTAMVCACHPLAVQIGVLEVIELGFTRIRIEYRSQDASGGGQGVTTYADELNRAT